MTDTVERVLAKVTKGDPDIWPQIWLAGGYSKADLVSDLRAIAVMQEPPLIMARNLAVALHEKHFPEVETWEPLSELEGLILQIDNMTSALVRQTWQDISTAPRDGTEVIIWVPILGRMFVAKFEHGTWQHGVWVSDPRKALPTHWMHKPAPPEAG